MFVNELRSDFKDLQALVLVGVVLVGSSAHERVILKQQEHCDAGDRRSILHWDF